MSGKAARYHALYMDIAWRIAMMSHAQRLRVGSVIVRERRILSYGWNGMPAGWPNGCEVEGADGALVTRPEVLHSEANAVAKLAEASESARGSTMYVTHAPCIECAKLIHQSGIAGVIYERPYRDARGLDLLQACGVRVRRLSPGGLHGAPPRSAPSRAARLYPTEARKPQSHEEGAMYRTSKQYEDADDVREIAERLIEEKNMGLDMCEIRYVKVYPKISNTTAGQCRIATHREHHLSGGADYIIEMSGDLWDALDAERRKILTLHELLHVYPVYNDKRGEWNFKLRSHDVEDFYSIIDEFGADWFVSIRDINASVHDLDPEQAGKLTA